MIEMFKKKQSTTLVLVVISWLTLTGKFAVSGLTLPVMGANPAMTGIEYGTASALILGIWLGREAKEAWFNKDV